MDVFRILVRSLAALVLVAVALPALPVAASATPAPALTRYPYLTDAVQNSITVNWATTTAGGTAGSVTWGPAGGTCAVTTTPATKTNITVGTTAEYQWKASLPVGPDTAYCYRVLQGATDLLGTDPSPRFTSQVAAGSTAPFTFAVFGDWGQAYAASANADQTGVLAQIANSGARFAVMTGDTAYPGGTQTNYGDLQQTGTDISAVFAPTFWGVPGRSIPVFNVTGNHGFTNGSVQVVNWPEGNAAASSNGKYLMEPYPSVNGSNPTSYPSFWYAFDAGGARFYVLTASWGDQNIGTGSVYANDAAAHWTPSSAEYQWLQADLAAHPGALKFAFWHYPLYADSSGQPSDTSLQGGAGTLQGLLDQAGVAIVFNGHAHGYERNVPDPAGLLSYVFGNGGAALGAVSGCHPFDAYAIGASASHCGAGPAGLSNDHVFGYAKVAVSGRQVTVTPTDEQGRTFDIQTYTFPTGPADTQAPTPPTVTGTAPSSGRIDLAWSGATDNVGVTGYRVYREGTLLATTTTASYSDTTVAPSTTYSYEVTALDAAGNESARSAPPTTVTTPGAPDTTAPSQPGSFSATATSSSTVNLAWAASTDNIAVTGYKVYRDGTLLSTITSAPLPTTYTDETASPSTTYAYAVSAIDAAGNESTRATAAVTTPGAGGTTTLTFAPTDDATIDQSQPTVNFGTATRLTVDSSPINNVLMKFTVAGTHGCPIASAKLRMTVGNTANDNSVHGGEFFAAANSTWTQSTVNWNTAPATAGAQLASLGAVDLNTSYLVDVTPAVTGDGTLTIRASSTNADGARYYAKEGSATQAPQLQVTCGGGGTPDTQAPTTPGALTAAAPSANRVDLSWTASTDNVAVTGYRIYRNGGATPIGTVGGAALTYSDTTVTGATAYTYQVSAVDAAGNESPKATASVTTPSGTAGSTLTFAPTDDATIDQSQPTVNFGTATRLTVDSSPVNNVLMKFTVAGTNGCSIASAKLRMTVGSATDDKSVHGGEFFAGANSTWSESSVNWNTAPATAGAQLASLGAVDLNTSYLVDVTPAVSGDGTVTIRASSTNSDGARYYAKEGSATQAPQLQVTCR